MRVKKHRYVHRRMHRKSLAFENLTHVSKTYLGEVFLLWKARAAFGRLHRTACLRSPFDVTRYCKDLHQMRSVQHQLTQGVCAQQDSPSPCYHNQVTTSLTNYAHIFLQHITQRKSG